MTEEQALGFWRTLAGAGVDAMLTREHKQAPNDGTEFEVVVWARRLHGKKFFDLVHMVEKAGLEMTLETEGFGDDPIYSIFTELGAV